MPSQEEMMKAWMAAATPGEAHKKPEPVASGKKITFWSTMDDVVMKKTMKVESQVTIVDADHHTYEMWGPAPDGKMFKTLEVQYTRKK
jgi:hypothetical protein